MSVCLCMRGPRICLSTFCVRAMCTSISASSVCGGPGLREVIVASREGDGDEGEGRSGCSDDLQGDHERVCGWQV